jgi:hypothetical protein
MDQNRKFAEMNGLCWHFREIAQMGFAKCSCGAEFKYGYELYNHIHKLNPDFSDPREVLKVVDRDDLRRFLRSIAICPDFFIKIDYITTPGKLQDAWIEWKEKT